MFRRQEEHTDFRAPYFRGGCYREDEIDKMGPAERRLSNLG